MAHTLQRRAKMLMFWALILGPEFQRLRRTCVALLRKRLAHPVDVIEEMVDENAAVSPRAECAE